MVWPTLGSKTATEQDRTVRRGVANELFRQLVAQYLQRLSKLRQEKTLHLDSQIMDLSFVYFYFSGERPDRVTRVA